MKAHERKCLVTQSQKLNSIVFSCTMNIENVFLNNISIDYDNNQITDSLFLRRF